ncbi:Uncharacterised protein [Cutibacterium granulosum]|uniref:Uncharacterized protein n=1 Tax=Cutibacterium granulosum TaxID=33011 RepID=A0A239WUZ0_9ACTN|nr:hypothetical protein [Cutibacterium granulosum]KAG9059788.1 hypothetical protein L860_000826 [Cutibacterium granulosum DSM 20700]SNV37950.1 Uncharacterised protein [Cutibacterium granulosum]
MTTTPDKKKAAPEAAGAAENQREETAVSLTINSPRTDDVALLAHCDVENATLAEIVEFLADSDDGVLVYSLPPKGDLIRLIKSHASDNPVSEDHSNQWGMETVESRQCLLNLEYLSRRGSGVGQLAADANTIAHGDSHRCVTARTSTGEVE